MCTLKILSRSLAKVGEIGLFWWVLEVLSHFFEYGVYPIVIAFYGRFHGGAIMLPTAFLLDWSLVKIYDYFKKDCFALEQVNGWMVHERVRSKKMRALLKGLIFIFLSVWKNPFVVTLLFRKKSGAYEMSRKDWISFGLSALISNLWWIWLCDKISPLTRAIWQDLLVFFQA